MTAKNFEAELADHDASETRVATESSIEEVAKLAALYAAGNPSGSTNHARLRDQISVSDTSAYHTSAATDRDAWFALESHVRGRPVTKATSATKGRLPVAVILIALLIGVAGFGFFGKTFVDPNQAPSGLPSQAANSTPPILGSKDGDEFQDGGAANAEASGSPKLTSSTVSSRWMPSFDDTPSAPPASQRATVEQQKTSSRVEPEDMRTRTKLAPMQETRPKTIEGWTIREVVNGVAVLEGPNGVWRSRRGDTVPGLGKVDSIVFWGHRWIVATSRGLVSTP